MLQINDQSLTPDRIVKAEQYQAYLDSQKIIESAENQAQEILVSAEQEFETQKQLGFQQGLEEGRAEIAEEMINSVSKTVDYFEQLESRLVDLVISAVRKVIGEIESRDRIIQVVRQSLNVVRSQSKVTIRVTPDDYESVQSQINDLLKPYPAIQFLDVVADRRLESGGCILETDIGVVNAGVETQIKAIQSSLQKSVGSSKGETSS